MRTGALVLRQVRFTHLAFVRNPAAAIFTVVFPLVLLVLLTTLLGDGTVEREGVVHDRTSYYVVAMAVFGLISACYTNVAMSITLAREQGVLKRMRGTPLPTGAYLAARLTHAALVGSVLVVVTIGYGVLVGAIDPPSGVNLLRLIAVVVLGSVCFAALGLAVSTVVPTVAAAPPLVNGLAFPLLLLSGVFVPIGDEAPGWVTTVAGWFPVQPLFDAVFAGAVRGTNVEGSDLGVVALWLLTASVVAVRRFRWQPSA